MQKEKKETHTTVTRYTLSEQERQALDTACEVLEELITCSAPILEHDGVLEEDNIDIDAFYSLVVEVQNLMYEVSEAGVWVEREELKRG